MRGALHGLRVLELSEGIAGPVAAMCLADHGADVVKVEVPAGDRARRCPGFAVWNRNKSSVVADPGRPEDRAWLGSQLRVADLCVTSGRASLERHGIDPERCHRENPRLVVLHVAPSAGVAPWHGGRESNELLAAATGVSLRQSSFSGGPVESIFPHLLMVQGAWASACAVAALYEREASGRGQAVTVTGVHAVLEAAAGFLSLDPSSPEPHTDVGPGGPNPCYTRYRTRDGHWVFLAALGAKFARRSFTALDVEDVLADPRLGGAVEQVIAPENRGWVRDRFAAAMATKDADEWRSRFQAADVPCALLGEREAWLDHPQLRAIAMRVEVGDEERGTVVMGGVPLAMSVSPGAVHHGAPRLGDGARGRWDEEAAPGGEGRVPSGTPANRSGGGTGPLAGVRVLHLGTYLAGPYAGHLLAGLGADVVKLEAPAGDPFKTPGFTYNRGMRGLGLDLSVPEGRAVLHRMMEDLDVVMDNARAGVLERLGADYGTLSRLRTGLIALSVTGFGSSGPLRTYPAFDPVVQAMSGMMTAQGGDDEPVLMTVPINDVAAAALSALGVCLALYHRARTGEGQRVETSLAATGTFLQGGELVRFPGRPPCPIGGRDFAGRGTHCYVRVADGYVRVEADDDQPDACADAGLEVRRGDTGTALGRGRLSGITRRDAAARLAAAGVPATPARRVTEVVGDDAWRQAGLIEVHTRRSGQPYTTPGVLADFSRTPWRRRLQCPGLGEHSTEVLIEHGFAQGEVSALIAEGIVVQGEPFEPKLGPSYR